MRDKLYSIRQAVDEFCNAWKPGEKKTGPQICNGVRAILHKNGNPACPMDGTVTRVLRYAREDTYTDIVCYDRYRSEFIRKEEE